MRPRCEGARRGVGALGRHGAARTSRTGRRDVWAVSRDARRDVAPAPAAHVAPRHARHVASARTARVAR
ncbi:hypothetical protein STTU_1626 [Streptomyces sp. Tu6071]|nr:hypothetical protein STTU_1626 [Streptomyces sp. Tu6071]